MHPPLESSRRPTDSLQRAERVALWGRGCAVAAAIHNRTPYYLKLPVQLDIRTPDSSICPG